MIPDIELVGLNIALARDEARTQAVWKESKKIGITGRDRGIRYVERN
jgi:hypothetical protein